MWDDGCDDDDDNGCDDDDVDDRSVDDYDDGDHHHHQQQQQSYHYYYNSVSKCYDSNSIVGEREDEVRQAMKDLRTAGTLME